jgi:hypothetical protein
MTTASRKGAYLALHADDSPDPDAAGIWKTTLPIKVKFFVRLLYERLNPLD